MKRILTLLMLITAVVTGWAQNFDDGTLNYTIKNGNAVVAGLVNASATEITIPETVTYEETNYPVTSIKEQAFFNCEHLEEVTMPSSVTSIGNSAFQGCSSLQTVTLSKTITAIPTQTFTYCSALSTINIDADNALTTIGLNAFAYSGLTNIPANFTNVTEVGNGAFMNCAGLTDITLPNNVTTIGNQAFSSCSNLSNVNLNNVTTLGTKVFNYCTLLKTVNVGKVTTIPAETFKDHANLESINLDNVTSIGNSAFSGCSALTSVGDLSNVTSIGEEAFYWCSSLTSVDLSNATSIGAGAFRLASLKEVTLSKDLESLNENVFLACGLETVNINTPSALKSIGDNAFYDGRMKSFTIPSGVTTIGSRAFSSCNQLQSITIPNTVTSIGSYAFLECAVLENITFEDNSQLETIGESAFQNCSKLSSVTIPNLVTKLNEYTFQNCTSLNTVILPTRLQLINRYAFQSCSALTNFTLRSLPTMMDLSFRWTTLNLNTFSLDLTDDSYIGNKLTYYPATEFTTVKYQRTMANQWGTLCLPFAITFDGSEPYDFYDFSDYDSENNSLTLTKVTSGSLAAKTPIIVRRNAAASGIEFQGSDVTITEADLTGTHNGTNLTGNFAPTTITSGYYIANDQFWNASGNSVNVKAFRAYINDGVISSSSNKALSISVSEDVTTGILQLLNNDNGQNRYYDLNGREMNDLQQGVNIVKTADGKTRKVIIK